MPEDNSLKESKAFSKGTLGAYMKEVAPQRTGQEGAHGLVEEKVDPARLNQWTRLKAKLRSLFGEDYFQQHLLPLRIAADQSDSAGISVILTGAIAPEVRSALERRLLSLWYSEDSAVVAVRIITSAPTTQLERKNHQYFDRKLCFEKFIVAEPNEFAYAAAQRIAQAQELVYNPLFLFGGVGLGKTHLMSAIALYRQQHFSQQKLLYLTAESFMRRFISALRKNDTIRFKKELRDINVLMIDDIHFIVGKKQTQEEFFHTLNDLMDQGKQVVVASDRSPHEIDLAPRIRSRLGGGLVAEINAPDLSLRTRFLEAKAAQARVSIPDGVIDFLAQRLTLSIRELEGVMMRLIAHQDLVCRPMTLESCRNILRDVLHQPKLRITVENIQQAVSAYYQLKLEELLSSLRTRQVARPRQIAMYLCKRLTNRSLPDIGRKFGGRDHTTVLYAINKVEALSAESEELSEDIRRLTEQLRD